MSVEFKNWQEICKEKDERIKGLEGKFEQIIDKLKKKELECDYFLQKNIDNALVDNNAMARQREIQNKSQAYFEAIEIVKKVVE